MGTTSALATTRRSQDGTIDPVLPEAGVSERGDDQLELTIQLPAAATPEQIVQAASELILAANSAYIANGGSGLKIDSIEVRKSE